MIILTESAVGAVRRFIDSSEKAIVGLRIKVEGGGCSGLKYGMKLEETVEQDDSIVDFPGVRVVIDPASVPLLENVNVDFLDGLEGSGFKFENPNATASCGCGKSFAC
jgi:iron-sulfur cluster assembly protein